MSGYKWTPIAMQTGFATLQSDNSEMIRKIKGIMMHFMERAIIIGSEYAVAAGRDIVTSIDILYALQYQARTYMDHVANTANIESLFDKYSEEESESESDSDLDEESDSDSDEDSDETFTRCENPTNDLIRDVNLYHDTWDSWTPDNPFQQLLKNAVDHTFIE
jgi:hypothetical protein